QSQNFIGTNVNVEIKEAPQIKGVPRLKLGVPKVLAIPKPGGADIVQISGLTDSKVSGIPITPGIPKAQIKGIPKINSKPGVSVLRADQKGGNEIQGGRVGNVNPGVSNIAKPIDLDAFLNE